MQGTSGTTEKLELGNEMCEPINQFELMLNFNWQKPMIFDWERHKGCPFTKKDLDNCAIIKILENRFHPPNENIVFVRQKPWWNPQRPSEQIPQYRPTKYIPGEQKIPNYPQLSKLTKLQHEMGLRVLSTKYAVQPLDYPLPTENDFESFENIKVLYEKEQKEYRLWAKVLWNKGGCNRMFHPNPLLETVYKAQFELKKNEIHTIPQKYTMAGQISLENKIDAFELKLKKNLKSVNVKSLPMIDYPRELFEDLSIMQHCEVPKPCYQHASRFILPYENTVSVLPLPEVHRELANYAMENDAAFVASENALQCLLDSERAWKLPVSVVEVICPEGDVKTVVVLGSEFSVQYECGAQRTFKAYRHLLRNAFTKLAETSKSNFHTHTAKQPEAFRFGEDNPCSTAKQPEVFRFGEADPCSTAKQPEVFRFGEADPCSTAKQPEVFRFGEADPGSTAKQPEVFRFGEADPCSTAKQPQVFRFGEANPCSTAKQPDLFRLRDADPCSSDDDQLYIDEQRRRSTESPHVTYYTPNSSGTRDAEMPSCFEIDEARAIEMPSCFEIDEARAIEIPSCFEIDEARAIEMPSCFEIDEARVIDEITLNTSTLSIDAINEIIGVNPISSDNMYDFMNDMKCTCKGSEFEVPAPRSFKKWEVKNATSKQSFDMIVHSSHKVRHGMREVILEPIVEWQPELGACMQSEGRLRALGLSLMLRPNTELINVRIDYKNGNVIAIDKLYEDEFVRRYGDKKREILDIIHTTMDQLRFLKKGSYVLAHDSCHGSNAMLYSTLATPRFTSGVQQTLSLRPDSYKMSRAAEAAIGKIPPELSGALLPFHKEQGILPLAFTPNEEHVTAIKKIVAALDKAKQEADQPSRAAGRSMGQKKRKKRKKKKKTQSAKKVEFNPVLST